MGFRFHSQILTIHVFDSKHNMHRKPCRRKEHKPGPIMRTATSTSFSPPSFRHGRHQTPHFSRSTDERGEARIDFVSHGVRFRIHSRPTDRNQGESVRPSRRKPFSANKGGRRRRRRGEEEALGWVPRIGPLQTNTHVNSCVLFFTFWSSARVRERIIHPRIIT